MKEKTAALDTSRRENPDRKNDRRALPGRHAIQESGEQQEAHRNIALEQEPTSKEQAT